MVEGPFYIIRRLRTTNINNRHQTSIYACQEDIFESYKKMTYLGLYIPTILYFFLKYTNNIILIWVNLDFKILKFFVLSSNLLDRLKKLGKEIALGEQIKFLSRDISSVLRKKIQFFKLLTWLKNRICYNLVNQSLIVLCMRGVMGKKKIKSLTWNRIKFEIFRFTNEFYIDKLDST